jgi:nitronate monooxygenase
MAFASGGELASAVTGAGAFGFFGAGEILLIRRGKNFSHTELPGFLSSDDLKANLSIVRKNLGIKEGASVPVGLGFIGWILEMTEKSDDPRLPAQVHEYDSKREHKTLIFVIVNSAEDALRAAKEWKVDVLVVQGEY